MLRNLPLILTRHCLWPWRKIRFHKMCMSRRPNALSFMLRWQVRSWPEWDVDAVLCYSRPDVFWQRRLLLSSSSRGKNEDKRQNNFWSVKYKWGVPRGCSLKYSVWCVRHSQLEPLKIRAFTSVREVRSHFLNRNSHFVWRLWNQYRSVDNTPKAGNLPYRKTRIISAAGV